YRKLIYKAKLYPEKVGKLRVDPFKLRVQYYGGRQSVFGAFGLNSVKTTSVSSPSLEINVKPLPAENVPADFTGLVGKHQFKLSLAKNKFLVNEAMEVKLEIEGEGALEKYDGPTIFTHPNIEAFDSRSEVLVNQNGPSRKIIEYTYLARGPLSLKPSVLTLSYFNPETKTYQSATLDVPAITVLGGAVASTPSATSSSQAGKSSAKTFGAPIILEGTK